MFTFTLDRLIENVPRSLGQRLFCIALKSDTTVTSSKQIVMPVKSPHPRNKKKHDCHYKSIWDIFPSHPFLVCFAFGVFQRPPNLLLRLCHAKYPFDWWNDSFIDWWGLKNVDWLIDWLIGWLIEWLTDGLIDRLIHSLTDWITNWLTDWWEKKSYCKQSTDWPTTTTLFWKKGPLWWCNTLHLETLFVCFIA